jgi:putative peptidoglycan lipid II flippase
LISRISGFFREIVMAAYFGTSQLTDAWLMASMLPNLLFSTINAAISTTMVPIMTEGDAEYSPASVQRFLNELFTAIVVLSLILILFGEALTPEIIHLVALGFHGSEVPLTIEMTRIMVPTIIFWGLSGIIVGVLQEREQYFLPSVSPAAINVVRIATIVILGKLWGIQGVALGFTLAVISQLFVTWPALKRLRLTLHFRWHFSHPLLRQMIKMAGPYFLVSSVGTVGVIVDRILASTQVTGSLAALNYSYVLIQIPVGLLIASLATPIYTRLSHHHSHRDQDLFHTLAMKGFRLVLLVIVPITLWFITLRIPILRLLYQHGAFSNRSTILTAGTLLYFAVGLPGFGLSFYLQKLFFATQNTRSPSRFSIITIVVNIIGDLILVQVMHTDGLALATAAAAWVNTGLLTWAVFRDHKLRSRLGFRRTFAILAAGATPMFLILLATRHWLHLDRTIGALPLFFGLGLCAIISGITFAVVLAMLHYPEIDDARRWLHSRYAAQRTR